MDGRLEALTSIRFFAAFFVLLSHLGFLKDSPYDFLYVEDGFVGVTLFFILSGFILSYSYRERLIQGKVSYKKFWFSRIFRIYPLHFLTLLLAIPLSLNISNLIASIPNLFLFQSLIPIKSIYFSLNAPSWSISTEMFFYTVFPILILLNKNYILQFFLILIFVQVVIINFNHNDNLEHALIYIHPFLRVSDFILGIMLFQLYSMYKDKMQKYATLLQGVSVFILILFICLSNIVDINQSYKYSLYYLIPMSLVIIAFAFKTPLSDLFNNKFLFLDSLFVVFLIVILSVFLSIFLYYKFEKPSQKYLLENIKI